MAQETVLYRDNVEQCGGDGGNGGVRIRAIAAAGRFLGHSGRVGATRWDRYGGAGSPPRKAKLTRLPAFLICLSSRSPDERSTPHVLRRTAKFALTGITVSTIQNVLLSHSKG
jgi:hypothetical protein